MKFLTRLSLIILGLMAQAAMAYPEYATRYNTISCTACHLSPVGGGPKTVYGKLFGAHGYKMNPLLAQDYVSGDFRALYYYPQKVTSSGDGFGVMSASVSGHVALDEDKRIHLVIEQNIGGFAAAPYRDTYALFKFGQENHPRWLESILVGRFRAPFGLIIDEHRTYTRIQTATEWYTFESGLLFSGGPTSQVHYDLAIVSGEKSAGQTLPTGEAARFGSIANVRWMPGPFMLGLSVSYHDHTPASDSRKAVSLSAVVSLARWTSNRVPLEINLEHVRAWGWDANLGRGFAGDPDYVKALGNSESQGYLALLDYWVLPKLVILYKLDYLIPDKTYPSDNYTRHGLGVRYYVGPNTKVEVRTEVAKATPPSEAGTTSMASQNATFAVLQLAF